MANMLPQEEQRRNRREYAGRVGIVALSFFLLVGFAALITLVPTAMIARQKVRTLKGAVAQIQQGGKQFGGEDASATIEETGQKIALVLERKRPHTAHEAFSVIAKDREQGIAITGLSYTREDVGTTTLGIVGTAATREGLIAFTRRLEREKIFTSVHLPIANLTLYKDIDFSLSVTGMF